MISRELEAEILRLHHAERWPIGTLARQLHVHHTTVRRVLRQAGIAIVPERPRPSMLDPYAIDFVQPGSGSMLDTAAINALADGGGGDPGGGGADPGNDADYPNVVTGTAAGEQLLGTSGRDLIRGLGGADTLFGFGGDDKFDGGDGNDYISGGNGSFSGSGTDILIGGAGNDTLVGEDGNDTLFGGAGDEHARLRPCRR